MSNHQQGRCDWNLPRSARPVHATLRCLQWAHYHVTDCWITYFGPSLGPTHSPIRACPHDGAHVCMATSLLKTTLTSWRPFFFFPLQHVCNSPAVPQIEAFSLIYHQSARLSAEQGQRFRPGRRREEKKKKENNNVRLRTHSDVHNLIMWSESLYTKPGKKQKEKWVWFVLWPVIDFQTGLTGADENNFLSFLCRFVLLKWDIHFQNSSSSNCTEMCRKSKAVTANAAADRQTLSSGGMIFTYS